MSTSTKNSYDLNILHQEENAVRISVLFKATALEVTILLVGSCIVLHNM